MDLNTLTFTVWYSEEDECWLSKASGFSNGQTTTNHGDTPQEALAENLIGSQLIFEALQGRSKGKKA